MSPLTKGYVAMSVVLLIWSGFALTVRAVSASSLTIADVMLIRFSVPLVLLTPWVLSSWHEVKNIRLPDIMFVLLGGVPFLLLAAFGASTVPAAYVGTILTGTPVFFAAILSFIFLSSTNIIEEICRIDPYSLWYRYYDWRACTVNT
ncbi:permease of the drug/metabolite transporter (DMT) superfamily [Psychrobacter sp. JCM 18901]|nr:permease of the drug/metabolite transporter (DMT) superfamily [Psychrobacter sp. JCM 18901]